MVASGAWLFRILPHPRLRRRARRPVSGADVPGSAEGPRAPRCRWIPFCSTRKCCVKGRYAGQVSHVPAPFPAKLWVSGGRRSLTSEGVSASCLPLPGACSGVSRGICATRGIPGGAGAAFPCVSFPPSLPSHIGRLPATVLTQPPVIQTSPGTRPRAGPGTLGLGPGATVREGQRSEDREHVRRDSCQSSQSSQSSGS